MAWTAPRTWVTAETVTAALLNTHLRDNLNATSVGTAAAAADIMYATAANTLTRLPVGTFYQVLRVNAGATAPEWGDAPGDLDIVTAETVVANTASETTVYTFSVPGSTLGTNNLLRLSLWGIYVNTALSVNAMTVRVKYGATTMLTMTGPNTANATIITVVDVLLKGDGTTSSQEALGRVPWGNTNSNTINTFWHNGTAAIDSTAAQNLVITTQFAGATTINFTTKMSTLELLKAV